VSKNNNLVECRNESYVEEKDIQAVLDLAKLKKGDSIYFKKKNSPKLAERYDYSVIIVGGR
jgi:hypothetical protein